MMGQEHMRNIALLEGARVAAVCEPDAGMADKARGIAPDVHIASELDAFLGLSDIDCILVASPNYCHTAQLREIAARRPLPLLVEKPLFTDAGEADALLKFRAEYPAPVWVAMEYRYMPPIAKFLSEAPQVTGGVKMLSIREHRFPFLEKVGDWNRFNRYTGGTMVEKCCHFFDLMRHVLQDEPVRVMASIGQAANHLDESYSGEVPDIVDHGYAIVDFEKGARAMLELCMFADGATYQEEISAVGPEGKIEVFVPGPGRFWPEHLGPAPIAKVISSPRAPKGPVEIAVDVDPTLLEAGDHNGSTFYQHQKFLELMRGQRSEPEVTFLDGWTAVRMGQAAQESSKTGKAVFL